MTDTPTADPFDGPRRLEIPPGVEDVDLERKFGQLLFRASLLGNKLTEQQQAARAEQRELLGILVEVDDALAALGLDRELVALGRGEGIEATRRRLLGRLAKAKVRPMRLEGLTADPDLAEIVGVEARSGVAPETVVRTVVTGFFWGDEVLRRAQVVVAAPEPEPEPVPEPEPEPVAEPVPEQQADAAAGPVLTSAEVEDALQGPQPEQPEHPEHPGRAANPQDPQDPQHPQQPQDPQHPQEPGAVTEAAVAVATGAAAVPATRAQPRAVPPRARRKATAGAKRAKRKK
ncbi:nucleotide exchange factor GrpE [Kitasatospora sp. NPDC059599]|uniref:nucleotide exchange factor GrpE n=1 Tax=Kitasatospora sp. NPDC059599 TaxID=3346880 RepID=UPI0036C4689C